MEVRVNIQTDRGTGGGKGEHTHRGTGGGKGKHRGTGGGKGEHKGNRNADASWHENVENVQFPAGQLVHSVHSRFY